MTLDLQPPSLRTAWSDITSELSTRHGLTLHAKRLLGCLVGGMFLALMVGKQAGTNDGDFHVAFTKAWFEPRVAIFLGIGAVVYLLITLWPVVVPYVERPGMKPLLAGVLIVIIAQFVLNWSDQVAAQNNANGRFLKVNDVLDNTSGLGPITGPWFSWLAWTMLGLTVVAIAVAVVARGVAASAESMRSGITGVRAVAGYVAAVIAVVAAVLAYVAHDDVDSFGGIDHSFGMYADIIGFLVLASAGLAAQLAKSDVADTRAFLSRVMDFRPGLLALGVALVWGLLAFTTAGWFGSGSAINYTLSDASTNFEGYGLDQIATQYLSYLGYVLFAACIVVGVAASWRRNAQLAWVGAVLALASVILTFLTLRAMTSTGARVAPQYGKTWQNLGAGGFAACMVFSLIGAAMAQTISGARKARPAKAEASTGSKVTLPFTQMIEGAKRSNNAKAIIVVLLAVALFYPPTLTITWQNVLVTQIGVYVLLAVGLNVVVGWAGLLDLGYIAFYEIGSYTTAYLTGSLPVKPPHWLHAFSSPLWSIPAAIIVCLIAGVLLGAPTLRLRGDYLAIVTLGFGEIIQQVAVNNPGGFTGGPVGPNPPHPELNLGFKTIHWGGDNLPYWYLLLVLLVAVVILFYRLENSRIGRAWAAIREDEVAAQASGVNTTRIKLLAFAIGASTSGIAGVFFATQVGYFDPTLFTLQASILIVAYVVFGGMGSLYGAMAGAAVLTWLPQFLKNQVPIEDRQMWVGALVLAMMIFRPQGLIPARRRKAELLGLDGVSSAETRAVPASEGV